MSSGVIAGDFHVGGTVRFVPTYTDGDTSHCCNAWFVYDRPAGGVNVTQIFSGISLDEIRLNQSISLGDATDDSSSLLGKWISCEVEFDVTGIAESARFGPIGPGFALPRMQKVVRRYFDDEGNRI